MKKKLIFCLGIYFLLLIDPTNSLAISSVESDDHTQNSTISSLETTDTLDHNIPKLDVADDTIDTSTDTTDTTDTSTVAPLEDYDNIISENSIIQPSSIITSTWGSVSYSFDTFTGILTFTSGGTLGISEQSPWNRTDSNKVINTEITKIIFSQSVNLPSNSSRLFSSYKGLNLTNLTSIEGLNKLNTTTTSNMSSMFNGTQKLTSLDLSNFNTTNVTSMGHMFYSMNSLKSINLGTFNTTKVTAMDNMFAGTSSLEVLDLSTFNFANTSNKKGMFSNTINMSKLTLPETFSSVENDVNLPNITKVNGYNGKWISINDISMGTSAEFMNNFNSSDAGTYAWGKNLWGTVPWEFDSETGTLTFIDNGTFSEYNYSPWNRMDDQKVPSDEIKKIVFTDKVFTPMNSSFLFSNGISTGLNQLTSFEGMAYLDTTNATNMYGMFNLMSSIASLDLSSFDTNNVTNMNLMFSGMTVLSSLDLTNFKTGNVTDMGSMFSKMTSLDSLDLMSFDTSNVTDMSYMFNNSTNLTSLDLGFNTSNVTNMSYMFANTKLDSIDVSSFNTSNVIDMSYMFSNIATLTSLNLESFKFRSDLAYTLMFNQLINVSTLTLSPTFNDPTNISNLPSITKNDIYTGNWAYTNENNETVGTTEEFFKNFNENRAGTYIWETTTDLFDPANPDQTVLVLKNVPTSFDFETTLNLNNYFLSTNLEANNDIVVYNNRLDRNWSVRASVVDDQLKLDTKEQMTFPVTLFSINDVDITSTSSNGIVASSPDNKQLNTNVGEISTEVTVAQLNFTDGTHQLKANSKLQGTIRYQLYNTENVE